MGATLAVRRRKARRVMLRVLQQVITLISVCVSVFAFTLYLFLCGEGHFLPFLSHMVKSEAVRDNLYPHGAKNTFVATRSILNLGLNLTTLRNLL